MWEMRGWSFSEGFSGFEPWINRALKGVGWMCCVAFWVCKASPQGNRTRAFYMPPCWVDLAGYSYNFLICKMRIKPLFILSVLLIYVLIHMQCRIMFYPSAADKNGRQKLAGILKKKILILALRQEPDMSMVSSWPEARNTRTIWNLWCFIRFLIFCLLLL